MLSVIIPVYNAEKTIRRCVESILFGNEKDIQIILAEDCSEDKSWEVCKELEQEYFEVQCTRNNKNCGVSYTRNKAMNEAKGEWILFVDSDDWVSQNYAFCLGSTMQASKQNDFVLCGYSYMDCPNDARQIVTWGKKGDSVTLLKSADLFALSERILLQQLWNKIFRRDIIEQNHIHFDETLSMGEDFQFVLDYLEAARIERFLVINEPLYYYIRWNNSSLMSKFGLIQNQQEYSRIEQMHRLSGLRSTKKRDAMVENSRRNYVYHIARNTNLSKTEKLTAIEHIMADGKAAEHYRKQQMLARKEKLAQSIAGAKNLIPRLKGRLSRKKVQRLIRRQREMLRTEGFSIISQNCIGGVFYHDMGMQFLSPTINTFVREPDFAKLCCNLEYYMGLPLQIRWDEEYPVGRLDDIEIHFMHYETCKEAADSWERRKNRINFDKILVLATDRDGFDGKAYEQWKKIPYPKVLFTANPEFTEDAVFYPEFQKDGMVGDLISGRQFYRQDSVAGKYPLEEE